MKAEDPGKSPKFIKSIANFITLRGDKIYEERKTFEEENFGLASLYSKKVGMKQNYVSFRDSHRLFGHEKSIGILSNNQSHNVMLERTLRKATMMFQEKAYLHHYDKFGVSQDKFAEAFLTCETALAEYKSL